MKLELGNPVKPQEPVKAAQVPAPIRDLSSERLNKDICYSELDQARL